MAQTIDYVTDSEAFVGPDTVTVTNEGYVYGTSGHALDLTGGVFTVTINGIVNGLAVGKNGVNLTAATGLSKVTVGANGELNSSDGFSLFSAHAVNLTNSGTMYSDDGVSIAGGATSFTIVNSGTISALKGTALLLTGTAAAVHTITNNNLINGGIDASGSLGADKITSLGLIDGDVNLGNGANYFVSKAKVNGDIITGTGVDTFLNYDVVAGNVTLGDGADIMTNNKTIIGTVSLGIGNDKFTNAGEVYIVTKGVIDPSQVSMGADDDIYVGGKYVDWVKDEDGKDSYDLGDGLDFFTAVGTGSGSADTDTINGGAHTGAEFKTGDDTTFGDTYSASGATNAIFLNLDSVVRTDLITSGTTKYAAYTGIGTDIGTDVVKGFEQFWLGSNNDLVFGTANADYINGNFGDDTIYGGKGNDFLFGNNGADKIIGEAGRDMLTGDAGADLFIFRAIADSTLALTGRDTILDFVESEDKIDVSAIVTTKDFVMVTGTDFNTANLDPEIRAVKTSFGYTLQFDSNGDNKIDMAIDIKTSATINWDIVGDFIV